VINTRKWTEKGLLTIVLDLCDLCSAFLKHVNVFNEVSNFTEEDNMPELFCELMNWLKEMVAINKAYPELRSEPKILYNGRKRLVVAKTKAGKL